MAIDTILKRDKDVYICLPTGGGKSLTYQLPTLCFDAGLSIIVSPLLALINDQIAHLKGFGVRAESINSSLSKAKTQQLVDDLAYGQRLDDPIKFVYVCPETLKTEKFMNAILPQLKMKRILYLAIDEAHCVSQMGHDFRKDYLQIFNFVEKIRSMDANIPVICLTATATQEVRLDIEKYCGLRKNYESITGSTFRNNLYYDVKMVDSQSGRGKARLNLIEYIQCHFLGENPVAVTRKRDANKNLKLELENVQLKSSSKGVGIIYCRTRDECNFLAEDLKSDFDSTCPIKISAFHAGFSTKERDQIQTDWQEEKIHVIIATLAFGMGIDKSNVRFVVHWNVPKSLTAYYQESGRAGRDGLESFCRLYFSVEDCRSIRFLMNKEFNELAKVEGQDFIYFLV